MTRPSTPTDSTRASSTAARSAPASGPSAPPDAPTAVVRSFISALETLDLDAASALLDAEVVYENKSLPTARGREATRRVLGALTRYCTAFEVDVHRLAAEGPVVLTERTDTLVVGRLRLSFWVCGTFEVLDGRIVLWRDYFDWAAVTGAFVAGTGRALGSLLRLLLRRPPRPTT